MTTTAPPTTKNGVNVDALVNTVKAIDENPDVGSFQFRSSTQWKQGAQVETTFEGHAQNGVDSKRDVPLKWGGDEPVGLLGTGLYQGPTDSLLHSMVCFHRKVKRHLVIRLNIFNILLVTNIPNARWAHNFYL